MAVQLFFTSEIGEFQKIVGGFIDMVDTLAKEVEKEKMKVRFLVWMSVYLFMQNVISLVICDKLCCLYAAFPKSVQLRFSFFVCLYVVVFLR